MFLEPALFCGAADKGFSLSKRFANDRDGLLVRYGFIVQTKQNMFWRKS